MGKRKSRDDESISSRIGNTICSEIRKRLRSYNKSIGSCTSSSPPQSSSSLFNRRLPDFICISSFFLSLDLFDKFEDDVWTEIAKYLDGKCIVMLGSSCRWFRRVILEEESGDSLVYVIFKFPHGSHSYLFRQQDKHIDWMRIGAFFFDSSAGLLTEKLPFAPKTPKGRVCRENVADNWFLHFNLQQVRCPVCNLDTCEGTMQTLDARHIELVLIEGYKNGSWDYKEIGSYQIRTHSDGATGAIFDIKHLKDRATTEVLDLKSWAAKPSDWQPRARIACHGVAVNTNLQQNDGLHVAYHAMRAGEEDDSEVFLIRISQQLL
ncbi:hypothetical protein MKX01_031289 [Papaver californicum]|nr:hypothetical protein MKX01_031289 [Papaver californicum]